MKLEIRYLFQIFNACFMKLDFAFRAYIILGLIFRVNFFARGDKTLLYFFLFPQSHKIIYLISSIII